LHLSASIVVVLQPKQNTAAALGNDLTAAWSNNVVTGSKTPFMITTLSLE
jgi:hypothetical protein